MKLRNQYYEDDYDLNDEMLTATSQCGRFSRRNDVTSFNMTDYQSCENCRHMTADDRCILGMQSRFTNTE